jgi:site-specific DNA-methyltransferase (adenine-specific)/site-specific DNA-methyltransferase (cytosine-N4-specific)
VEEGRLHDLMLLDQLVRIADGAPDTNARNLGEVAQEYANLTIDKEDPYRIRYAEIIGRDWSTVEAGFFTYAIKDAIATILAYRPLRKRAKAAAWTAARYHGKEIMPNAHERFGLLTEGTQVKFAVALAQVGRNGICVDQLRVQQAKADLLRQLEEVAARMEQVVPGLHKLDKAGKVKRTPVGGAPSVNTKKLDEQLLAVKAHLETEHDVRVYAPATKTTLVSKTTDHWRDYRHLDPFIDDWLRTKDLAGLLKSLGKITTDKVHPHYVTLKETGRVATPEDKKKGKKKGEHGESKRFNILGTPRDGTVRHAFVPSPGHHLLILDYNYVELAAFAATCMQRYGKSAMGDVIKAGTDPHAYTAGMMLDRGLDAFLSWKNDPKHKTEFDAARQGAKPVNFGVIGGMHERRLIATAKSQYGVTLTYKEAQEKREQMQDIYPELREYLREDTPSIIARALNTSRSRAAAYLGDIPLYHIKKVLMGDPKRADGEPYQPYYVEKIWNALQGANENPELEKALTHRESSDALACRVCSTSAVTLTGRLRGGLDYTQTCNTPFQGLAADGAALALFELVKQGYRVVAFIHDEVLVELPDEGGFVSEEKVREVEDIMRRQMESVLVGNIPVKCGAALSSCWSKKAEPIARDGKVFPWQPDTPPAPAVEQAQEQTVEAQVEQPVEAQVEAQAVEIPSDPMQVVHGHTRAAVVQGDSLAVLRQLPADSMDLLFGSPPYEDARSYGIDFALSGQDWVDWMVSYFKEALRVCNGLVAAVVAGRTEDFRWSATPALLLADLHRAGIHLRTPPIFHRHGIPGSGGPDWLRNDYELVICASRGGKLPWSDPTACGKPPKYRPGGKPSHRTKKGGRVERQEYTAPQLANPGNVVHCKVGGGRMGSPLAHQNEAPLPEALAAFFVQTFCPPGGIVLDPWSGSGTTGAVALQHGRRFVGIDVRQSQVELTQRRLAPLLAAQAQAVEVNDQV